jgi:hypothetical protein
MGHGRPALHRLQYQALVTATMPGPERGKARQSAMRRASKTWIMITVGLTRKASEPALGSSSCSNSSRFGTISTDAWVTPVMLPPGRLKLATSPSLTGLLAVSKTIGMVVVAAFAASTAGVLLVAITATCR